MQIYTVFDDNFLKMAKSFVNSLKHFSDISVCVHLSKTATKSIDYCLKNNIKFYTTNYKLPAKQTSRLLKMDCPFLDEIQEPIVYLDIDIIFQNDIKEIEDLNPAYLWVLSKREGHQTTLRTWKKHYFTKKTVEFARKVLPKLTDFPVEEILESPVRNCGVIYGNRLLMKTLFSRAKDFYLKMLNLNKKHKLFSDSDQLCFLLAFYTVNNSIRELPVKFNRMPYHQSYDFKDISSFVVPDTVILHLNRCKDLGKNIISAWNQGKKPIITTKPTTRSGIVIPIQTSNIAERSLTKNLYSLAVSNRANVYRDEDVGFPIARKVKRLNIIRDSIHGERPAFDKGLFFMVNDFLFMIDHGEHTNHRAGWIIGKYVIPHELAGIFIEQMDKNLDVSQSKIPIIPLAYGVKYPSLWLNQGKYHTLGIQSCKKYSVHFIGNFTTNKNRRKEAEIISKIPDSKIEHRNNAKRINFDDYMQDMAHAHIAWCPPGGRPKTHREIEAMCCEVAIMMPYQNIIEPENIKPDFHYICIKDDYSDVVQKVEYYLKHRNKLSAIALNGRIWYENNASDYARAKYIHEKCLQIINSLVTLSSTPPTRGRDCSTH